MLACCCVLAADHHWCTHATLIFFLYRLSNIHTTPPYTGKKVRCLTCMSCQKGRPVKNSNKEQQQRTSWCVQLSGQQWTMSGQPMDNARPISHQRVLVCGCLLRWRCWLAAIDDDDDDDDPHQSNQPTNQPTPNATHPPRRRRRRRRSTACALTHSLVISFASFAVQQSKDQPTEATTQWKSKKKKKKKKKKKTHLKNE